MKNVLVYILLFAMLTAALTACNANTNNRVDEEMANAGDRIEDDAERAEDRMEEDFNGMMSPMPDMKDGTVNDNDGIITEGDNGPLNTPATTAPATAAPKTKNP